MQPNQKTDAIVSLFTSYHDEEPATVTPVTVAGSPRLYARLSTADGRQVIGTSGTDLAENKAFINLSQQLSQRGISVPEVLAVSDDGMTYLQTDAGTRALFDIWTERRDNDPESVKPLLKDAMKLLATIHTTGSAGLDFSTCFPQEAFDARNVRFDLNYFKYCFLKVAEIDFDEIALQDDFDRLENLLLDGMEKEQSLMLRDFQSRNIMVDDHGKLTVIDFQGGRRGPREYDLASFLWQAKAAFPEALRNELLDTYAEAVATAEPGADPSRIRERMPLFVLFRAMQTLGAYGYRGLIQQRPHFVSSIEAGKKNLAGIFRDNPCFTPLFPEIKRIADSMNTPSPTTATDSDDSKGLTVTVMSFSYRKGSPVDPTGNGGGFVFDCRAIHNPGRYDRYKPLTGMDGAVIEFLENDGEVFPFLQAARTLVDAAVEKYIKRGFTSLQVAFGCTGGRHRSVYSAHAMATHLRQTYPGIKIKEIHREQPQLAADYTG